MIERTTWPLWQCLSATCLADLIQFQRKTWGTRLELLRDIYRDLESLEEIDRLMRRPPVYQPGVSSD